MSPEKFVAIRYTNEGFNPEISEEIKHGLHNVQVRRGHSFSWVHIAVNKLIADSYTIFFNEIFLDILVEFVVGGCMCFYGSRNRFLFVTSAAENGQGKI